MRRVIRRVESKRAEERESRGGYAQLHRDCG